MTSETRRPLVVVVDDEPAILRSLERLLRRESWEVVVTGDPREALALAGLRPVDLVLTDHRMPGMSGAQLVGSLAMFSPSTSTVILTGFPDDAELAAGAGRQARGLVAKPWNDEELLRTLRDCLPPEGALPARTVPCRGRTRGQIIGDVEQAIPAAPPAKGLRIHLAELSFALDSVSKILAELVRLAERREARLIVSDDANLARTFLEGVLGRAPRVAAAEPRRDG